MKVIRRQFKSVLYQLIDKRIDQRLSQGIDVGTGTTSIRDDRVQITAQQPTLQLEGTEGSALNLSIRENAGQIELFDEAAAAVASAWNLNPLLEPNSLETVPGHVNLMPEGAQRSVAVDSTGYAYSGDFYALVESWMLDSERRVYLEGAYLESSAADEEVTLDIYDVDAGTVLTSPITFTADNRRARSTDIKGNLTAGNQIQIRWDVTTASGTGGATADFIGARLVIE